MTNDNDELLTVGEVARTLGVHESWVRRRIRANDLPYLRLGQHDHAPIRIARTDLVAWVRAANPQPIVQKAVAPWAR